EGHKVVAIIAADDLAPNARSHIAEKLGVSPDGASLAKAMAAASIRPDTEFRKDRATPPWHYIDICLQDRESDITARCLQGNCVTAKIDEYVCMVHGSESQLSRRGGKTVGQTGLEPCKGRPSSVCVETESEVKKQIPAYWTGSCWSAELGQSA